MHATFYRYSEAYAAASNEQMLLNLARRANGHPAYFLQMGLINANFTFGATATGMIQKARGKGQIAEGVTTNVVTGSGTLGFSATEQPTFSFTPLSGSTFAAAIFNPIDYKVFFSLFEQGQPVDVLMRTMIQSFTFTDPPRGPNEPGMTIVISNVLEPERQANYRNFLRLAGTARELQKQGLLTVAQDNQGSPTFKYLPGAHHFLKKHLLSKQPSYKFEPEPEWTAGGKKALLSEMVNPRITFHLRTYEGILTAVANEYHLYDEVVRSTGGKFIETVPPSQREPILRIDWEGRETENIQPLVEVSYRGRRYAITDPPNSTWNRQVFTLLTQLLAQVSLDPNKLPTQQLIQVR
jgi:hypothetical protein